MSTISQSTMESNWQSKTNPLRHHNISQLTICKAGHSIVDLLVSWIRFFLSFLKVSFYSRGILFRQYKE